MNNEHQHLYALTEHILKLMQDEGGPIPFQTWMQAALYQPNLGYYEREQVFGKGGDFTTASAMGSWLAMALAESISKSWLALGSPQSWTLIEQGGGSGELMCAVLNILAEQNNMPSQVFAVETSVQLLQRQQQLCQEQGFDVRHVAHLNDIPTSEHAVMYSNELPDAFPVQCFVWRDKKMIERGVDWDGQVFVWKELDEINPKQPHIAQRVKETWNEGYISEFNPFLSTWQQDIAQCFENGIVITIDYGYTQQEYYRAQRIQGTLMGHHQHQVVDDVLNLSPGVCDITAHVDFSALKQIGETYELQAISYTTQGAWLAQSKTVQTHIQALAMHPSVENMAQITQAKRLMLPTGMGESFKVFMQHKGKVDTKSLQPPAFERLNTL